MEARKHLEDLRKDVSCSICLEYFEEPVSLDCGHVFCRGCIVVFWKVGHPSCPECRRRLPGRALRPDRRMANIVGTVRSLAAALGDGGQCQGLGSWCRTSPEEPQHLNPRAGHAEGKVKGLTKHLEAEFAELHKILHREEQEVKRQLQQRQQEVLHRTGSDSRAMAQVNPSFLQVMWHFLQDLKTVLSGPSEDVRQDDQVPVNMLKGEFGGPVQYTMWKQMRKSIKPALASLTLCPQSAHPSLFLSENMTRVNVGYVQQRHTDNSKRFLRRICVLGSRGFTSGRHYWEVEVHQGAKWILGVVRGSVRRKELDDMTTPNGYWVISPHTTNWLQWLVDTISQKERTSPQPDHLTLEVNPKRVGVYLDYEGGQVSFYNAEDMSHLYTHSWAMIGKLFPFFSPGTASNNQMSLLQLSL
ncbi:zinc finger protein RFP-like isoform X1 [Hemiscyllium ocellatum]|uniref:zinc finger protein RFP-like isoform X1 n=1 Tax=Hemiscyllium ocellatum TaxID=170820 RepID=UPI002966C865|nr:zinc finger protein RFP-like isoform X1 [Hemiscyllium ocellatum]